VGLFVAGCYALFLGCLFHAIKLGIYEYREKCRGEPLWSRMLGAVFQVFFLLLFAASYYLLESAAHTWTPFFVYSPSFPDGIPLWGFGTGGLPQAVQPVLGPCETMVKGLSSADAALHEIPLSVLLMESSLTYAAMWTALMLEAGGSSSPYTGLPKRQYRLIPLWAALFVVILDALLDPVVSAKYDCSGLAWEGDGAGLGLWHWFLPTGDQDHIGDWFGVPVFNYAAWWSAPLILISLVLSLQWGRSRLCRRFRVDASMRNDTPSPIFLLAFTVVLCAYLAVQTTRWEPGTAYQWGFILAGVLGTAIFVVRRVRSFSTRGRPDPTLTLPPLVFLGLAVTALLVEGLFLQLAGFVLVGFACLTLIVLFTLWPYERSISRVAEGMADLDRFMRLAYFGFPSVLVLLGASSVALDRVATTAPTHELWGDFTLRLPGGISLDLQGSEMGGLLIVALCFQIFAYVHNDVRDLPIDRSQQKRKKDPLIRGAVTVETALSIAVIQIPAAFLAAFLLHTRRHHGLDEALPSCAALGSGFLLMYLYNRFGKSCPLPPLMDAIQAAAWGSLVLFGALFVDPGMESDNWLLVWTVFAFGAGFILLINGVHGGLRDLENDVAHGCNTTARWLGAVVRNGAAVSNAKIRAWAYVVQTAMFVLPFTVVLTARSVDAPGTGIEIDPGERWFVGMLLGLWLVVCHWALCGVVRDHWPRRDRNISQHPLILMSSPLLSFAPFLMGFNAFAVLAVCFLGPLLANPSVLHAILRFTHPGLAGRLASPGTTPQLPGADTHVP
jgi:4-hydroxybenzoate polyprenyltransferase/uncharacterized membrane protein YphA (DoxX/SURF4 family)